MRRPEVSEAHGRGLFLVDAVADSWHSGPSRFGGTVVSAVVAGRLAVERRVRPPSPVSLQARPSIPPVLPALVALAHKVADEHRARTGTAIDTPTLRARLGVPVPLAGAIAAQLT